jgi:hypothetical protein
MRRLRREASANVLVIAGVFLSQFSGEKLDLIRKRSVSVDEDHLAIFDAAAPAVSSITYFPQQFFHPHFDVSLPRCGDQFLELGLVLVLGSRHKVAGLSPIDELL